MALDSAVFIYLVEEHPQYLPIVHLLFEAIDRGQLAAVTSALTLMEVLVVPLRNHDLPLARRYELMLSRTRGLRVADMDRAHIREAALLRAEWPRLRAPDALQLAAALVGGCSSFVTNDRKLPAMRGMKVLQLEDYVEKARRR